MISNFCNTFIEHVTGDGFRTLALRQLITPGSLVVSNKRMIQHYYKDMNSVTVHGVKKIVESGDTKKIKLVFIDTALPRIESRAHKALLKLCKGKQIALIQPPHDARALSSLMELLSVTKNPKMKVKVFNRYMFTRGRW